MIYIVGIGPGHRDYILPKALKIMEQCDIIIGFKRAVDSLEFINVQKEYMSRLSDLDKYLKEHKVEDTDVSSDVQRSQVNRGRIKNVAIIASGDPTFYGITNYIKSRVERKFEVIPGISSFQYLTSKVRLPWNNAYTGSLHGRKDEFIKKVREHEISIWLTDKENNPGVLCRMLQEEKIECMVIIGENLSYDDEVISEGSPHEFIESTFSDLNIFIVHKSEKN
ncbi:precorrin-6y C5,15-methyltransferase (decarboxylating) subunit CbiE [uncultured Clostridium sp.]|uniref:precorrin-6y C5,15-methyltransferase (decarboxylating) subunit CbiE n=1 Tax=uncultured Clostridium sp. TaxID=59620 RepID=UPI0025F78C0E|nr:precorrin-6y C5,15-methyltransferase (decarboxylating) subunit CbiE [uncultured Clostridium sp.]